MFWNKKDGAIEAAVDSVINAMLERPDDFNISELTMTDEQTKYIYWISNGSHNAGLWRPYKLKFGTLQGRRFLKALTDLKTHQLKTKTDLATEGK